MLFRSRIRDTDTGQFLSKDQGLVTFTTVCAGPRADTDDCTGEQWKLVSRIDPATLGMLRASSGTLWATAAAVLGLLFLACWVAAALYAKRRQALADLTEHYAAIQRAEETLRAITSASRDAIVMLDDEDPVTFWNPAAQRMFGYDRDEIGRGRLHDLVVPEPIRERARKGFARFAAGGGGGALDRLVELDALRKDGETFPAEISVARAELDGRLHAVGTVRDITRRKQAEKELVRMATTDSLTGLSNRGRFFELGRQEFARAKRYGNPLSVIMFDVDHFKSVNDTHGHDAGDAMLRHLADLARNTFREADVIGRVGGEEFAVLLPETPPQKAFEVAERFRKGVANSPVDVDGESLVRTVSLGVAGQDHCHGELEDMLKAADQALYDAKHAGRDRTLVADTCSLDEEP